MKTILCLAAALAALAQTAHAQRVEVEFDHGVDFAQYRSYTWRQPKIKFRNPALDNSLVDRKSTQLVWRAIVEDTKSDAVEFEKHLDKDVNKAFDTYPPKK